MPSQSLAILGDSFTFGLGVEDCEAFASLLALERRESRVLNLGVPGSALPQQLFIVSKRQSEMRDAKTYLFFFFLGNDYADMINAKPYWWEVPEQRGDKKRSPVGGSSVPRRLLEYVNGLSHHKPFSYSYLLQFARAVVLRTHLGARATSVDAVFKAMLFKDIEYLSAMRTALRVNLNYLRTLLGQTGAKVAIIAVPDRYQLLERIRKDQAEYYGINVDDLDRFIPNRILAQESASAGIPLLDSSDCLDNRADKVNFYYTNDNHFTKAGHKAFFDCIRGPVAVLLGDAR